MDCQPSAWAYGTAIVIGVGYLVLTGALLFGMLFVLIILVSPRPPAAAEGGDDD